MQKKQTNLRKSLSGSILTLEEIKKELLEIYILESSLEPHLTDQERVKKYSFITNFILRNTDIVFILKEVAIYRNMSSESIKKAQSKVGRKYRLSYDGYSISMSLISVPDEIYPYTDIISYDLTSKDKYLIELKDK